MTTKVRPEPKIPDHEVLRKIGGGAYGEVWLARGVTGVLRAAKVVWRDDFDDERGFEREFEGIRKYEPVSGDHPGLVNILHVGRSEADGEAFYYCVMELGDDVRSGRDINPVEYEARTLRGDMKAAGGKPLDVQLCIEAGRAVAEGLQHLHEHGLAHRDVKPSNVIFVDGKAKLADIGLVAFRDQRTFVGTEGFVPPEGPGSAQADVYSLGKVLYEMVTGKDRLDFPELPDELPTGKELRKWRAVNAVICDICEPRVSRRKIKTAEELAQELARLERGKGRPIRLRVFPAVMVFLALLSVLAVWRLPDLKEMFFTQADPEAVEPVVEEEPQLAKVTIISAPLGAEVYDAEGTYLKDTPLGVLEVPVGSELTLTFRKEGYRTTTVTTLIEDNTEDDEQPYMVIGPFLEIYAPPVMGDPWKDVLGMVYKAVEEHHVSVYYVSEPEWETYRAESSREVRAEIVPVDERGLERRVVFCSAEEAAGFADWLRDKLEPGYLTEDHILAAVMDESREFADLPESVVRDGWRPFRIEVKRIPYATIKITSTPEGAAVYLDGQLRGETPLLNEAGHSEGVRVKPGMVELVIEAEGFKPARQMLTLRNDEVWAEPMHFDLEQSAGVVFEREWTNSLGMNFVPVGEDLMASVWETRISDFRAYQEAVGAFPLESPEFEQGDSHPVVFVSPTDARSFCEWLTEKERGEELIAQNHRYRLPTDREWSRMAGLPFEAGEWPQDRAMQPAPGYPWGGEWPPPPGAGNYADETAVVMGAMPANKQVINYDDGVAFTAQVGTYRPNPLGIYDLGGNVHEWVDDLYGPDGQYAVSRGGGWNSYQSDNLTSSFRIAVNLARTEEDHYGFRVVLARETLVPEEEEADDEE